MRRFLAKPVKTDADGRAVTVPLGLRRVESALLKYTNLSRDDIVCTTPEALPKLLGPQTKIVAVSSSDPLGMGMSNTTTTAFWSGQLYTKLWTTQMLQKIGKAKKKYGFKVIGGGAGAWQWNAYDDPTANEVIDTIFEGYFENAGPTLFADILDGIDAPRHVSEEKTCGDCIQPIVGASTLGIIELSRGCGRGCRFCTMANRKMIHLPPEIILADLETNIANGQTSVVSASEDFFRYGATGIKPDFDKLHSLLTQMQQLDGLRFMQIDHANVTSVVQLTDEQLTEARRLLTWQQKSDYLWVNMGIESANGQLVAANCPGKVAPFDPDQWQDIVKESCEKLIRTGFYPVLSLVLGLPGETPNDVEQTINLVKWLEKRPAVIFPIFYEPPILEDINAKKSFSVDKMHASHLELYSRCYEINFKAVPTLFWDNQRAGGVPWIKRAMLRMLGKTEVGAWRKKFKTVGAQIAAREIGRDS
jgi:hypothetical protein